MRFRSWFEVCAGLLSIGAATQLDAATASRSTFGTLLDGRPVASVTLTNEQGYSATVIAYGATLQSFQMPDAEGRKADITLGHTALASYIQQPQYIGATTGRFSNRLAFGRFRLDGKEFQTPVNNGGNALHGGTVGFDKVLWDIVAVRNGPTASVVLRHISRDGDQGYPGTMTVEATYSLDEDSRLTIDYRATSDAPTIANITNHAYWNLSGEGASALDHLLTIPANTYLPVNAGLIPTGELRQVAGSVFDFRHPRPIGERVRDAADEQIRFARGYDHNWVIARAVTEDQHLMARLYHRPSGRGFELWSNQPGLQFYSGNFLDGTTSGKGGKLFRQGDAIVLEPQVFPDSPNHVGFPTARLAPGQVYRNVMSYRFFVSRDCSAKCPPVEVR